MSPVIDKVALQIGAISIHWYGIILGTGALVGLLLAIREGKRKWNLSPDLFLDLILYGVPVSILFARLYYVAFEWEYYSAHPEDIFAVWKGGLAIHGASSALFLLESSLRGCGGFPFGHWPILRPPVSS
ncbi:hypothetical protein CULT_500010 [[Clostridium] ultunense Esp]|nr:hypothetical protein CULT_500010 [[Clostridium] ultunense Esp]